VEGGVVCGVVDPLERAEVDAPKCAGVRERERWLREGWWWLQKWQVVAADVIAGHYLRLGAICVYGNCEWEGLQEEDRHEDALFGLWRWLKELVGGHLDLGFVELVAGYLLGRHCCSVGTDTSLLTFFWWTILAGGREY